VEFKQQMWQLLADDWRPECLDRLRSAEVGLSELPDYFHRILAGKVRGRILLRGG
jgi:hypothetical protein